VQVVILAGGLASRLRPLTEKIPKSMLTVSGKPFLEHQIALLRSHGVTDVVLCVGFLAHMIEDYFGDGSRFGVRLSYSQEGAPLLGTGGAIRKAAPLLQDIFAVAYGDSYLMVDYADLFRSFRASGYPAAMVVYRNEDRWDRSNVVVEGERVAFYSKDERPPNTVYIDAGVSILRKDTLRLLPPGDPVGLDHLMRDLTRQGLLGAYETQQRFYEIGSFSGLEELQRIFATLPAQTSIVPS
jgi:NDP-sugar pyrophosphorylase family protein